MGDSLLSPVADVVNKALDKISDAIGWGVNHETPKRIATSTFISEVQKSNLDPASKAIVIRNARKIIKEYQNQDAIIDLAMRQLSDTANPQGVDNDWISQFMDMAKNISDSDYQLIWAQILAGEMEKPGSFSIGAIDKLRCLSKKDAVCFQKASKVYLEQDGGCFILANSDAESGLANYDLSFEDILQLSDCGLIRSDYLVLELKFKCEEQKNTNLHNESIIVFFKGNNKEDKVAKLNVFTFTEAGRQLLKVANAGKEREQILNELKLISSKYDWLEIQAFDVINVNGGNIEYSDDNLMKESNHF